MEEALAQEQLELEDTQKDKFLTFSLGNEFYGVEIRCVTEIIGILAITEVPELPDYIRGIINLRGKIIPVMDVRLRFKKEPVDYNNRTCVIVVEVSGISIGLIVDTVCEVISITEDNVVPPPQVNNSIYNKYIKAIGKDGNDVKLLLDCEKLISENSMDILSSII